MKKKDTFSQKVILDFFYCIAAMGILNIVTQFIIYPQLNKHLGNTQYGNILFLLSIITIMANSFGTALVNGRLTKLLSYTNKDFNFSIIIYSFISIIVVLFCSFVISINIIDTLLSGFLVILMLIRIYVSVSYRLTINFKKYFIFCTIIACLQLVGLIFFKLYPNWCLIFILGELGAIFFTQSDTHILEYQLRITEASKRILTTTLYLSGAYFLNNLILNYDRICLKIFLNSESVTIYYVSSLIGKTCALFAGPISSVMLSYYNKIHLKMNLKRICIINLILVLIAILSFLFLAPISKPFITYLYPNLLGRTLPFLNIALITQLIYLIINFQLLILLTFTNTKIQFLTEIIYIVIYLISTIISTLLGGLLGFTLGAMFANFLSAFFIFILQIYYIKKEVKNENRNYDYL